MIQVLNFRIWYLRGHVIFSSKERLCLDYSPGCPTSLEVIALEVSIMFIELLRSYIYTSFFYQSSKICVLQATLVLEFWKCVLVFHFDI